MKKRSKLHQEADIARSGAKVTSAAATPAALVSISSLRVHPQNPRKHSREQIRAIARSIEVFGFNAPILIDKSGQILCGHGRFEAAKLLGLREVPVVRLDHLNENQARAYILADNKLSDRSSWDDTILATHLKELSELALDFEIEATGFETPEIDFHIQSLESPDTSDVADEFVMQEGNAVSQHGDLWMLGEHRIFCGNSLEAGPYGQLLGPEKAAAVFSDVPFNVPVNGHVCGAGKTKHREFAMASGEMTDGEFTEFLESALRGFCNHTSAGSLIYVVIDWRHVAHLLDAARGTPCETLNLCVWVKSNGGMGSLYRSQHELVFVFRNGNAPHRNNIQLGRYGRNRANVWQYPGVNSFARKGRERALALHPTVKPTRMVADAILDSTRRGDIVLDPFLGSGTTILAAERTGRRGYGIEIDALYVDTAITRWQRMTSKIALHSSGQSFEAIRAERALHRE